MAIKFCVDCGKPAETRCNDCHVPLCYDCYMEEESYGYCLKCFEDQQEDTEEYPRKRDIYAIQ